MHSQNRNDSFGALVQLVRMPACHAGGHGFESRTHRKKEDASASFFVLLNMNLIGTSDVCKKRGHK